MYTENRGVKPQSGCVQTEPNPKIYFLPTGTFQVKKGVFSTLIYLSCLGRITSHRSTLLNTSSDAQGTRVFSIRDAPYSEVGVSMGGEGEVEGAGQKLRVARVGGALVGPRFHAFPQCLSRSAAKT